MTTVNQHNSLLPHLFRQEYTKLTAVLCRQFGFAHLEIAEDIASDTFLKAHETWPANGIPENPAAWLYAVAKNKAKDWLKHNAVFEQKIKNAVEMRTLVLQAPIEFSEQVISDSQLAMIFAVCSPMISAQSQICLALQVLCGFSIEEVASAFLAKPETIKKRLQRARANLRNEHFRIDQLSEADIRPRLDTVLKTLYLLFNEGYYSTTNNHLVRKDLCLEALRLATILAQNPQTNTSKTNAILALICYQCSRLNARSTVSGEAVLFEEQDMSLWDSYLIEKGNYYLINASNSGEVSKYHLEACIAYWHTNVTDPAKWRHILQLYNQLIVLEYSPVIALNRTFAFARVYGPEKGIEEAKKLNQPENKYYHSLLAYLYTGLDAASAILHYKEALRLSNSEEERKTMATRLDSLINKRAAV